MTGASFLVPLARARSVLTAFSRPPVHPLIRIPNQLVGAPPGTNVTLECEVEASPKSINFWTKILDDQG